MQKFFLIIFVCFSLILGCNQSSTPKAAFEHYCGSCHLAPDPTALPKDIWENSILPDMGARLGMQTDGFHPMIGKPQSEKFIYDKLSIYPENQLISTDHWEQIRDYILENAPDSLTYPEYPPLKNTGLFTAIPRSLDEVNGAMITHLSVQENTLYIGSVFGHIYQYDHQNNSSSVVEKMVNPISSFTKKGNRMTITEIGQMHPTDLFFGEIWEIEDDKRKKVIKNLQRPVFSLADDIDNDGTEEIFVCEFGNQSGNVSMFSSENSELKKKVILPIPGAVKLFVQDMNKDGKKDLIALTSQGQEGIWILFQRENKVFDIEKAISLSSVYGSSGFEVFDYEGDGDMDIAIANGDNADLSVVAKPYHGVRLFINDGNNQFQEKFFSSIFGATNLIAKDFDADGDMDFMVSAFFPESEIAPGYSIVFLENTNSETYSFKPHSIAASEKGKWLVLTSGDIDKDGDEDVIVGSFTYSPENLSGQSNDEMKDSPDILILENLLNEK